jgi:sporulation protein YlmC with PRC-barrel domain
MAKFIFTESQVEKIKKSLDEDYPGTDNNYKVGDCNISLYYSKVTYKGQEINDISAPQIGFTFDIDMDIKSYGIRGISVYNPKGPSEIELEVSYYTGEDDDESEDIITIPLDWENASEDDGGNGWIGYDNQIEITLKNDENGNIVVDSMTLFKNSF